MLLGRQPGRRGRGLAERQEPSELVPEIRERAVLVRVDPQESDTLTATTAAQVAVMRGRPMTGWLRVGSADLGTDDQLIPWVERGTGYARSLPPRP